MTKERRIHELFACGVCENLRKDNPPAATLPPGANPADVKAFEKPMRELWAKTRAISEVAQLMFPGLPGYSGVADSPAQAAGPRVMNVPAFMT